MQNNIDKLKEKCFKLGQRVFLSIPKHTYRDYVFHMDEKELLDHLNKIETHIKIMNG